MGPYHAQSAHGQMPATLICCLPRCLALPCLAPRAAGRVRAQSTSVRSCGKGAKITDKLSVGSAISVQGDCVGCGTLASPISLPTWRACTKHFVRGRPLRAATSKMLPRTGRRLRAPPLAPWRSIEHVFLFRDVQSCSFCVLSLRVSQVLRRAWSSSRGADWR